MTDHRVTDLSYGHLGKASYDTEENQWAFSNTKDQDLRVLQLLPLKEHIPSSIQNSPKRKGRASHIAKSQLKWLLKAQPETFPANTIASTLAKAHKANRTGSSSCFGSLLATGRAVDVDRVSGSRKPRILCMPCGEAGHILRLIRPRMERRGWGKHSAAQLSLLELESPEQGHWAGVGGAIQQIESAGDENKSGTWLAVRQDTIITIFRPLYGKLHKPTGPPTGHQQTDSASLLNPNPVASLSTERTKSDDHMDVAFNPWYSRQFAVVDAQGHWSIWDLERLHGISSQEQLLPGKSGYFHKDAILDPLLKGPQTKHTSGWHRILWVCNINTIFICNRRHFAAIDIKSVPVRLWSIEILAGNSTEGILDVKRSPINLNQLFILTTSQIFWVEVVPAGEDKGDQDTSTSVKVILSYRHFRDPNDDTMRITLVKNDPVTAFISSGKVLLVNFYCFWTIADPSGLPTSSKGSFTLSCDSDELRSGRSSLQTLCVLPASLTSNSKLDDIQPELEVIEQDVRFFQLWALTANLGLNSALFSFLGSSQEERPRLRLLVTAPTTKISQFSRLQGPRVVKDPFIVSDEAEDELFLGHNRGDVYQHYRLSSIKDQEQDDLRFRLNWKIVFQDIFGPNSLQDENFAERFESPELVPRIQELLDHVSSHIREGIVGEKLRSSTLHEISRITSLSGDLQQASLALRGFLESLSHIKTQNENSTLVLSDLTTCPSIQFPLDQTSNYPDLLKIYDQIADNWLASLPLKVSAQARLSKFRTIRQIAVELFLSSLAVSLRNNATVVTIAPIQMADDGLTAPELDKEDGRKRESSPTNFSSQLTPFLVSDSDFNLPTRAQTPSLYSHATSVSELREDPAISRLRQYAASISSKPDFGKPPMLSHWPATAGGDPANYSWEATQRATEEDESGEESRHRSRQEEARRRRRTEKFLRQERARVTEAASQPMVIVPHGSQPAVAQSSFSSQTVVHIPMTQPNRGAFGSRSAQMSKKISKKHRTAGF